MRRIKNSISKDEYCAGWERLRTSLEGDVVEAAINLTRMPRSIVALSFFEWVDKATTETAASVKKYFKDKDRDIASKDAIEAIEWAILEWSDHYQMGASFTKANRRSSIWAILHQISTKPDVRFPRLSKQRKRRASIAKRPLDLKIGHFDVGAFITGHSKTNAPTEFFVWLSVAEDDSAVQLREVLRSDEAELISPLSRLRVVEGFRGWENVQKNKKLATATAYHLSGDVIRAIVSAGENSERKFPQVTKSTLKKASIFKADHSDAERLSLAEADWPEFRGKSQKDCHALALVCFGVEY